jgi:hypothetical protein
MRCGISFVLALTLTACDRSQPSTPAVSAGATSAAPVAAVSAAPSASAATVGDAIGVLVAKLSASPLWTNGLSPTLPLPKTASVEAVLAEMFQHVSFDPGPVTSHRILVTRRVHIGSEPEPYTAVLVDTNLGRKIVLLRYDGEELGWWSRVFAVPQVASKPKKLVWREGAVLKLDRAALRALSDAERVAVGYLATTIGSDCDWTKPPSAAGAKGSMHCELTDALGLGEQCGEKHKAFVMGWLGDDAPSSCAKIPITAFSQTTFDELSLSRDGDRIVVSYAAVHTDGPGAGTQSWSETIRFAPRGEKALRIESRRVTQGKPPP